MLPVNCGSHTDYQTSVVDNLRKYYPNPDSISQNTWDIIDRFWNLDLSYTDQSMIDKYSKFGPAPRTPSCMQRSYLLSIDFKVSSITEWVSQLKLNPLYAFLSGFEVGDTPGIRTFYDFFSRLWDSDDNNLSSHLHKLKSTVKKPGKKGSKAKPIDKVTVEELFKQLEGTTFSIKDQPYGSLFELFKSEKIDFKLESGRHRSTKMWYCRLYHILMLQHLDAWDLPYESALRKLVCNVA